MWKTALIEIFFISVDILLHFAWLYRSLYHHVHVDDNGYYQREEGLWTVERI